MEPDELKRRVQEILRRRDYPAAAGLLLEVLLRPSCRENPDALAVTAEAESSLLLPSRLGADLELSYRQAHRDEQVRGELRDAWKESRLPQAVVNCLAAGAHRRHFAGVHAEYGEYYHLLAEVQKGLVAEAAQQARTAQPPRDAAGEARRAGEAALERQIEEVRERAKRFGWPDHRVELEVNKVRERHKRESEDE